MNNTTATAEPKLVGIPAMIALGDSIEDMLSWEAQDAARDDDDALLSEDPNRPGIYNVAFHSWIMRIDISRGVMMTQRMEDGGFLFEETELFEVGACMVLRHEGAEIGLMVMPTPTTVNFTTAGPVRIDANGNGWRSTGDDWSGVMTMVEAVAMARRHRVEILEAAARQAEDDQRDADALEAAMAADAGFPGDWIAGLDDQDPNGPIDSWIEYADPGEDPAWIAASMDIPTS